MSLIFFASHRRGKEVMGRDIIGRMPVLKPAVGSGHDLQVAMLPESAFCEAIEVESWLQSFLNPQVKEEKL